MTLSYDFDMFSTVPADLRDEFGDDADALDEQRALFRDPATVEALKGASREIGRCFLKSGFGLNVYDSGAGPGRFPKADAPARAQVIEDLMTNLERLPDGLNWNGFDIEAFAMAALNAKPLDGPARREMPVPAREPAMAQPMDRFFESAPVAGGAVAAPAPNMDDFFSGKPSGAAALAPAPAAGPDMDAFFNNTSGTAASGRPAAPKMTAEDIRMSIDTAPPKKVGMGPVKIILMAVALYLAVSFLAGGAGGEKLVEFATGGGMVTVNR